MVVTEELVKRACAAYDANRDAEGDDYPSEYPAMWHALTAALASLEPVEGAVWYDGGVALVGTDGAMEWVRKRGAQPLYRLPAPPAAVGGG